MTNVLPALAPVFVLIALGFFIRRQEWISSAFWLPCEKLNYFGLFPALMFSQVAKADFSNYPIRPMAYAILGAVFLAAVALFIWKLWFDQEGPVFSSVIQGALRPNTYVAVAAGGALFGSAGITLTSLSIAIAIPVLNVASVTILMIYGGTDRPSALNLLKALVKNPVILSVGAGLAYNRAGFPKIQIAFATLEILGAASLPLGLLAVGAGLNLGSAQEARSAVALSSVVKLLVVPLLTAVLAQASGLTGAALGVAVLFNAMPCTPSAYIMTKLLGGDHRLAAGIIAVQTIVAALTIPVVIAATPLLRY
jgi:predicted permease